MIDKIDLVSGERDTAMNVLISGPYTKEYIEKQRMAHPDLEGQFPEIGFRFDTRNLEKMDRCVLFLPGIWRQDKDKNRARAELEGWRWVEDLAEPRSQVQVVYPNHSFVGGLLMAQCLDLLESNPQIKKLDLVGLSYGNFWLLPLMEEIKKSGLSVEVKSMIMEMPGLSWKDLTIWAKAASLFLGCSRKVAKRAMIPSTISPHNSGLAVRAGAIPKDLPAVSRLPDDVAVMAIVARSDELMNPTQTINTIKRLFPKARMETLSGGHFWDKDRQVEVFKLVNDFWSGE